MRSIAAVFLSLCLTATAPAQHAPRLFVGAGLGAGSFPHLFRPSCSDETGKSGMGPDFWGGLRFGHATIAARAALIGDSRVGNQPRCSPLRLPSDGIYIVREYGYRNDDATALDVRVLYGADFNRFNLAAGLHAGSMRARRPSYGGGTLMLRYRFVGLGADYSLHRVSYHNVEVEIENGLLVASRDLGQRHELVSGVFFKIFAEMTR